MAPHDLPYGYDPDISDGDVSFLELEVIGNFYRTPFDFVNERENYENDDFQFQNEDSNVIQDPEDDWESQYPPSTPFVPTPEVLVRVDNLIKELTDRSNLLTFGTTDPQDNDYEDFFRHFETRNRYGRHYRYYDDDDDDTDVSL